MAKYIYFPVSGIQRPDGTWLDRSEVADELNRLAAENAALRELYGAAEAEFGSGRAKGSALNIGKTGKAMWDKYHADVRSHDEARKKHAAMVKGKGK